MRPRDRVLPWVAVPIGGLVGTGLRAGLDLLVPHAVAEVPWDTLLINAAGSYLLGLFVTLLFPRVPGWVASGLGVGMLGAFTTYSAYAVAVAAIGRSGPTLGAGDVWESLGVLAGGLLSALLFAWLGLASGRTATRYRPKTAEDVVRELDAEDERDEE